MSAMIALMWHQQSENAMADLLLDSLEIKNFRAFKHLRIEKLGRVNLVVGKNNVGKTTLLDAMRLYAKRGDPLIIRDRLREHDEDIINVRNMQGQIDQENILSFRHIFSGREDIRRQKAIIQIGSAVFKNKMIRIMIQNRNTHNLYAHDEQKEPYYDTGDSSIINNIPVLVVYIQDNLIFRYPLVAGPVITPTYFTQVEDIPSYFISASGSGSTEISKMWQRVALTDFEEDIVRALRLLSHTIERVNLVALGDETPIPRVRLSGQSAPVPLRSMGEGMNRMLGIALSLVNARDGFLLIDEIESGLHYSVQGHMWRLIFEMAHRLNIQVFATTHSLDCIQAFQYAANENVREEGVLIRLVQRDDNIIATSFDEEDLAIITRDEIEVR